MSPEKQRIALAKWAGFKMCPIHLAYECCGKRVPDYFHDLNAVHELENRLDAKEARSFGEHLCKVMTPHSANFGFYLYTKYSWTGFDVYTLAHSTAAQRCEALLKTLNLWEA